MFRWEKEELERTDAGEVGVRRCVRGVFGDLSFSRSEVGGSGEACLETVGGVLGELGDNSWKVGGGRSGTLGRAWCGSR